MNIALSINFNKENSNTVVNKIIEILLNNNAKIFVTEEDYKILNNSNLYSSGNIYRECDICIAVGGDGTIIHTAKKAAKFSKPVLGINLGRIGYLAAIETTELNLLNNIFKNDFSVEERIMLLIKVCNGKIAEENIALNDAVITKGSLSRILDINMLIGESDVNYRSDGLIVSTPTGSTAYSMSAGGPIVDPRLNNMIITPICPYTCFSKPFIIPADEEITIKVNLCENKEAYITIDGEKAIELKNNSTITITQSKIYAKLISLKGKNSLFNIEKSLKKGVI